MNACTFSQALRACDTEIRARYFAQSAATKAGLRAPLPPRTDARPAPAGLNVAGTSTAGTLPSPPLSPPPSGQGSGHFFDEFCAQADLPPMTEMEYVRDAIADGRDYSDEMTFIYGGRK